MPCHSEPSQEELAREQRFNDAKTRLACDHCKFLEGEGIPIPAWAQEWWEHHKEVDKLRKAETAAEKRIAYSKKRALAKLDPDERKVLGL